MLLQHKKKMDEWGKSHCEVLIDTTNLTPQQVADHMNKILA
jgi:hypothetical protein